MKDIRYEAKRGYKNFILKLVFFEPPIRIELISMLYKSIALTNEL